MDDESDWFPLEDAWIGDDDEWVVADRFSLSRAWATAAELVRRHPDLLVSRVQDGAGYPLLLVHDEAGLDLRVQFDLPAGVKYIDTQGELVHIPWADVLTRRAPLSLVQRIERELGLSVPSEAAVTGRTLCYQLIACTLRLGVDSRAAWDAVPARLVPRAPEAVDWSVLDAIPGGRALGERHLATVTQRAASQGEFVFHEPIWAICRDLMPVALVDVEGSAHAGASEVDLMGLWRGHASFAGMTTAVLGRHLD